MSAQIQPNEKQWQSPIGRRGKTPEDLRPIGTQFTSLEPPNVGYDDRWNNHGNPTFWEALSYEVTGHEPRAIDGRSYWRERLSLLAGFVTDWTEIPEGGSRWGI